MSVAPDPLTAFLPIAPDASYDTLRASAVDTVTTLAGGGWTDHNPTDPGITLLEVVAWALADVHYRTTNTQPTSWPLSMLLEAAAPHLDSPRMTTGVAEFLSAVTPPAAVPNAWLLLPRVEQAVTRADARQKVLDAGAGLNPAGTDACVDLLRRRLVRRVALDYGPVVRSALDEAQAGLPVGAPGTDIEAIAADLLRQTPEASMLWHDEAISIIRGELEKLASTTALPAPVGDGDPDGLEVNGRTTSWPPHPQQVLHCEPVTAEDYACRARSAVGVRRAWSIGGTLPGVAWHHGPTIITDRRGTLTLLIERGPITSETPPEDRAFLRSVLRHVLGEEFEAPWDALGTRRGMCDEVGAALIRHHPIVLSGTIHCALGIDQDVVLTRTAERVQRYLRAGRPRSTAPLHSSGRGPFPPRPQPATGWLPGQAIPLSELVQAITADPAVLGVSDLRVAVKDGPMVHPPVRVRATAAVTVNGLQTVDGVALASKDRVLLTAQPKEQDNGIYVVDAGDWQRADNDSLPDSNYGALVEVSEGSAATKIFAQTNDLADLDVAAYADTKTATAASAPAVWIRTDSDPASHPRVLEAVRIVITDPLAAAGYHRHSGLWLQDGQRVLLAGQGDPRENGIYKVAAGQWPRDSDNLDRAATRITEGPLAGTTWSLPAPAHIDLGVTPQVWHRTATPQPADGRVTGQVQIPAGGVPILARVQCLQVRMSAGWEATDAQP